MAIQQTVAQVRAKYGPSPTGDECAAIVNEIAWIHRNDPEKWGVSTKNFGDNGRLYDGSTIARDIVQNGNTLQIFDVLVAAGDGGPASPSWQDKGILNDPARPWKAPIDPGNTVPPQPPQPPQHPVEPPTACKYTPDPRIDNVLVGLALAHQKLDAILAALNALKASLSTLSFEGKILGIKVVFRAKVG